MCGSRQHGFTLLEVIVALFILTITMGGLVKSISDGAQNQSAIEERTIAQWVALNQIARMQLNENIKTVVESSSGVEQMANREWDWQQQMIKTDDPSVYRIIITVSREEYSSVLARTIGYLWVKSE